MMKLNKLPILALAGVLGTAIAAPSFVHAQEKASSDEMHAAVTEHSPTHLYRATRDEVTDAALTTKIKAELLKDRDTRTTGIHVKSNQGIVTLSGTVDSPQAAARAQKIVASVKGVQSVHNDLTWHTSAREEAAPAR